MDGAPCRSLRAQPCSSPNDRGNIWRSFTPIPRSMDARPLSSTYNDSSQSPHQPSTRWCSAWNVGDCSDAPPDRPAVSKCSLPPRASLSCCERKKPIDHYPCAEVLGRLRPGPTRRVVPFPGARAPCPLEHPRAFGRVFIHGLRPGRARRPRSQGTPRAKPGSTVETARVQGVQAGHKGRGASASAGPRCRMPGCSRASAPTAADAPPAIREPCDG